MDIHLDVSFHPIISNFAENRQTPALKHKRGYCTASDLLCSSQRDKSIENTARYLGIEEEQALEVARQFEI